MRNGSTIAEMLVVLCVVMLGLVMFAPTEQTPFPWHCPSGSAFSRISPLSCRIARQAVDCARRAQFDRDLQREAAHCPTDPSFWFAICLFDQDVWGSAGSCTSPLPGNRRGGAEFRFALDRGWKLKHPCLTVSLFKEKVTESLPTSTEHFPPVDNPPAMVYNVSKPRKSSSPCAGLQTCQNQLSTCSSRGIYLQLVSQGFDNFRGFFLYL